MSLQSVLKLFSNDNWFLKLKNKLKYNSSTRKMIISYSLIKIRLNLFHFMPKKISCIKQNVIVINDNYLIIDSLLHKPLSHKDVTIHENSN